MERKLTLKDIDERNSKVKIPDGKVTVEELEGVFITREDGSEVSFANAVYADMEFLYQSKKRTADREMKKLVDLREEGRLKLSAEDFLRIFGRTN
jgi:hypothetical protein